MSSTSASSPGPTARSTRSASSGRLDLIDETHGRRFDVARVYTLCLHERAALRKDLESWRGRKFTEQELDGFDLEKLDRRGGAGRRDA